MIRLNEYSIIVVTDTTDGQMNSKNMLKVGIKPIFLFKATYTRPKKHICECVHVVHMQYECSHTSVRFRENIPR